MLEGWFFVAAALLALSGGAKIRDPQPTRGALAAAGLPSSTFVVLLLGLIEMGAALAGLAGMVAGALAVGLLYASFAGFVGVALYRRLPLQSCGCFGRADTPPTLLHVAVNLTAAGAALGLAGRGGADLIDVLGQQPAAGLPYLFYLGLATYLLVLLLTRLPLLTRRARSAST